MTGKCGDVWVPALMLGEERFGGCYSLQSKILLIRVIVTVAR